MAILRYCSGLKNAQQKYSVLDNVCVTLGVSKTCHFWNAPPCKGIALHPKCVQNLERNPNGAGCKK